MAKVGRAWTSERRSVWYSVSVMYCHVLVSLWRPNYSSVYASSHRAASGADILLWDARERGGHLDVSDVADTRFAETRCVAAAPYLEVSRVGGDGGKGRSEEI